MEKINAIITGVGGYVPDYVLSNEELSRMVDTNDEWILSRVGIKERRILNEEGLGTSYMARKAAKQLIQKTGVDPDTIDALILSTSTADYQFPSTASIVLGKLGLKNAHAFDFWAACCGFLYSLDTAASMIQSGRYKKIIVIGADKMSSIVDYKDRQTSPLFGDGAAAVLLEATTEQEGRTVFRYAVTNMSDDCALIAERNGLDKDNIRFIIPHQSTQADIKVFVCTVARVEAETGLKFFDKLPKDVQKDLKTRSSTSEWGLEGKSE